MGPIHTSGDSSHDPLPGRDRCIRCHRSVPRRLRLVAPRSRVRSGPGFPRSWASPATVRGGAPLEREPSPNLRGAPVPPRGEVSETATSGRDRDVDADGLTPSDYHLDDQKLIDEQKSAQDRRSGDLRDISRPMRSPPSHHHMRWPRASREREPAWNMDPREDAPPSRGELGKVVGADRVRTALQGGGPNAHLSGLVRALISGKIESQGGWRAGPAAPALRGGHAERARRRAQGAPRASGGLEGGTGGRFTSASTPTWTAR